MCFIFLGFRYQQHTSDKKHTIWLNYNTVELYSLNLIEEYSGEILDIEQRSHQNPWSQSMVSSCFSNNHCIMGVFYQQKLVGYWIVSHVLDETELLNLCVDVHHQGQGIGKHLMESLIHWLKDNQMSACFLEVRVSNKSAIHLYKKFGFIETGRRKNYYACGNGERENALLMQR